MTCPALFSEVECPEGKFVFLDFHCGTARFSSWKNPAFLSSPERNSPLIWRTLWWESATDWPVARLSGFFSQNPSKINNQMMQNDLRNSYDLSSLLWIVAVLLAVLFSAPAIAGGNSVDSPQQSAIPDKITIKGTVVDKNSFCLLYTSPSPRDTR